MRIMKKTIAFVLALLILGAGFVSCRKKDSYDVLKLKYDYDLSEYIDLADYKNIPASGYKVEVTDEDVQNQILMARAYYSRLNDVTDRGAELGDTVYVDYTAVFPGGEEEPLSEEEVELTIGAGQMPEEFENHLIGAMTESDLSFDMTFPDPYYQAPEYAGLNAHFDVHVHEVCWQELPDYNDDFVRAYLGYESCRDYEEKTRETLKESYTEKYRMYVADQVWPVVLENTVVKKFPEEELNEIYEQKLEFDKAYCELLGMNFQTYLGLYYNITEEEYYAQAKQEAEDRIKEEMIVFAIGRKEKVSISEEEYQKGAAEYAKSEEYASVEALEAFYDKETILKTLLTDKVIEVVADYADVTIKD
jgi:trigger factor